MSAADIVDFPEATAPNPPLFQQQQAKNKRRTKVVNRILAELTDDDRADIAAQAVASVDYGFIPELDAVLREET